MSGYDIFGMGIMLGVTGLAVDQGWTWLLAGMIVWGAFNFVKLWLTDNRTARRERA